MGEGARQPHGQLRIGLPAENEKNRKLEQFLGSAQLLSLPMPSGEARCSRASGEWGWDAQASGTLLVSGIPKFRAVTQVIVSCDGSFRLPRGPR